MKNQQRWCIVLLACVASVGLFTGCDDHHDSAIIPPPQQQAQPAQQAAMQQPAPPPPQRQIVWQLPMSWKDAPTTQPGEMAVQVSQQNPELLLRGQILGNGASLNLVTIVNAWEKMLGKEPSDASAVEGSIVKPYIANDLRGHLVDIGMPDDATDRKRVLGAVFPDPLGVTMAFTLLGPDEQVAAQRENFRQFLDSLRIVQVPQQQQPQQSAAATPFRLKYQTPQNWTQAQAPQGMDLELRTGDPAKPVRLVVSRMAMETANSILNNPNALRAQADLPPLAAGKNQDAFKVPFGSETGLMFDLQTAPGETPRKRTLFAMCPHGGTVVCVQLGGPAEQVDAHLPDLEAFLKSIEFLPITQ